MYLPLHLACPPCRSELDLDGPPQAKRHHESAAGENEVDFSMASLARGAVTKVKGGGSHSVTWPLLAVTWSNLICCISQWNCYKQLSVYLSFLGWHTRSCVWLQNTCRKRRLHWRWSLVLVVSLSLHCFCAITVASKQLKNVALDLVKESFGDSHYEKALDCIKALREEAIKVC